MNKGDGRTNHQGLAVGSLHNAVHIDSTIVTLPARLMMKG